MITQETMQMIEDVESLENSIYFILDEARVNGIVDRQNGTDETGKGRDKLISLITIYNTFITRLIEINQKNTGNYLDKLNLVKHYDNDAKQGLSDGF